MSQTRVQAPDGTLIDFPAEMNDQQVTDAMQKLHMQHPEWGGFAANNAPGMAKPTPEMETSALGSAYDKTAAVGDVAADYGKGAVQGLGHTVNTVSKGLNKIPHAGEILAPSHEVAGLDAMETPTNRAQKAGFGTEQVGEYLVPGLGEEDAVVKGTALGIPKLITAAMYGAGANAGVSALQGASKKGVGAAAAIGAAAPVVGKILKPAASYVAEKLPGSMINRLIGVGRKELQYGNNPGKAVVDEGLHAGSLEGLSDAVEKRVTDLHRQLGNVVGAAPTPVNLAPQVVGPIDYGIKGATTGKVSNRALWSSLNELRDSITHELNVDGTRGNPKSLTLSPLDALDLKRSIGKITRWTPENASHFDAIQGIKRQIYHNIDSTIDQIVPGSQRLNERMSNLLSALESIDRKLPGKQRAASFLTRIGMPSIGTLGAAAAGFRTPEELLAGAGIGVGLNAAKDAALSTPGTLIRAAATKQAGRAAPAMGRVAAAGAAAAATHMNPQTGVQIRYDPARQAWVNTATGEVVPHGR